MCWLCVVSVLCVMCVLCYVIKTLGKKVVVTMNYRITILEIDPKFGLSIPRSNSKILTINCFNIFYDQNLFI